MAVEEAKMDSALRRDYLIRMQNQLQSDKRARAEGQTELVEAIRMFKDGKTQEDLQAAGIAQDTIDLALTCLWSYEAETMVDKTELSNAVSSFFMKEDLVASINKTNESRVRRLEKEKKQLLQENAQMQLQIQELEARLAKVE